MNKTFTEQFTVAVTRDAKSGKVLQELWRNAAGQVERHGDKPAEIVYCPETGRKRLKMWYKAEQLSRANNKPAVLGILAQTGVVLSEHYYVGGVQHRSDGGPTTILRSATGEIREIIYCKNGEAHRLGGPAIERYDEATGELYERTFCEYGKKISHPDTVWAP